MIGSALQCSAKHAKDCLFRWGDWSYTRERAEGAPRRRQNNTIWHDIVPPVSSTPRCQSFELVA